jgi:NADH-quinone oxidoreductase subunit M
MLTTVLILLPLVGAAGLWLTPWRSGRAAGGFALLVALAELALWIGTAFDFDFEQGGLQFGARAVWFDDLGVAYHVGLLDFSLWLVGLTALVSVAAVA